jgi:hypothetical protein
MTLQNKVLSAGNGVGFWQHHTNSVRSSVERCRVVNFIFKARKKSDFLLLSQSIGIGFSNQLILFWINCQT